ncbi:hypothetical protein RJG79_11995 [Mycoplasmatota bacterium WC44]
MKKLFKMFMLTAVLVLGACAVDENNTDDNDKEQTEPKKEYVLGGTLSAIMEGLYQTAEFDNSYMMTGEVTEERQNYYFGEADIEYEEALASEPMMGWGHSIVLVRVGEDVDVDAYKAELAENVDRCKWICVCVEEDEVVVESIGDIIVIIMDPLADEIKDAFLSMAEEK